MLHCRDYKIDVQIMTYSVISVKPAKLEAELCHQLSGLGQGKRLPYLDCFLISEMRILLLMITEVSLSYNSRL